MKNTFIVILLFLSSLGVKAQVPENDSLHGFDLTATVLKAHQMNLTKKELKSYINITKREYINEKFHLSQPDVTTNPPSKYSYNTTNNPPCVYEDFEFYPNGVLTTTVGWIPDQNSGYSHVCTSTMIPMNTNTSAVTIQLIPFADAIFGAITTSPFGGFRIAKINNNGLQMGRIRQTFPVTSSNWLYSYAYMGVLAQELHGCCQDPYLMFRFYDGGGNPISSLCHTVVMGTPSCVTTSTLNWAASTSSLAGWGVRFTPNWQIIGHNLSAFIGTVITVEVIAAGCTYSVHPGYMYYDAKCSDVGIIANDKMFTSAGASYTSCATTATLSGLSGFSSYQWQGPPTSTVSGSTNSVVTTNVSGSYTLTSITGTITSTQTLNLVVSQTTIDILGLNTLCVGDLSTLQVSSNGSNTYSWSPHPNPTLQTIYVTPSVTTTYSVIASNSLGCTYRASETITVFPIPVMSLLSNTPSICSGQTASLFALASGISSYTWNTGTISSSITVSPTLTTVYTVTGTTSPGCRSMAAKTIIVFPSPQLQVAQSSSSICVGQSATLTATGFSGNSYNWSTGPTTFSIIISPTVTNSYSVVATTTNSCKDSVSKIITVHPLPQIQMIASNTAICVGQVANFGIIGSNIGSVFWSNGAGSLSISVSPSLSSVYSVTVSSALGCIANQSASLIVNPLPLTQIIASSPSICVGESATLTASGSSNVNYNWNGTQTTPSIVVSPSITTAYVLMVSDTKGCSSNSNFQLEVFPCTYTFVGIQENISHHGKLIIYPNPSGGMFEIRGYENENGWLLNDLGQIISEFYLTIENNYTFKIVNLAKGIYFVTSSKGSEKIIVK